MRPSSPNSKARPTTPGARSGAPTAATRPSPPPAEPFVVHDDSETRPSRAAAASPSHEADVAAEADAVAHVVEDDDTLNMPTPSTDELLHRPAPRRPQKQLLSRTVGFKQTLIPILLTLGVLLPAIAGWSFSMGEESPVAGANWIPFSLIGIGAAMLLFAGLTMFQVRSQLAHQARP
jgi:hypothetical protein